MGLNIVIGGWGVITFNGQCLKQRRTRRFLQPRIHARPRAPLIYVGPAAPAHRLLHRRGPSVAVAPASLPAGR